MKKGWIIFLAVTILFVGFVSINNVYVRNHQDAMAFNSEPFTNDYNSLSYFDTTDYYNYLNAHGTSYPELPAISIQASAYTHKEGDVEVLSSYEGIDSPLLTGENSSVSWKVNVDESGYYQIMVHYFPYPGKSSTIERSISINGEVPFDGANNVAFYRIWGDKTDILQDVNGNDIRPSQVEKPFWTETFIKDQAGYVEDPYYFYFDAGQNTITFTSIKEPLLIDKLELVSSKNIPTYEEKHQSYPSVSLETTKNELVFLQAENHLYSTSPTLYPLNDRTNSMTMPSDPSLVKLNTIGGNNWRINGDKITWEFSVDKTGLYEISLRVKQKLAAGMNVYRNIYIDGEIPFAELENYTFVHDGDWRIQTLGDQDKPYQFYLESGQHTITMEVSLGAYGPIIGQIQNSINNLNKLYREILVYTGPEPDRYRDYQLTERIDDLIGRLENERDNLERIHDLILEISDSTSEKTGILDTVILQLNDFIESPRNIHKNLSTFNSNISSLGTLVLLLSAQPLEIDYFMIHGEDVPFPDNKPSILQGLSFSVRSFFSTFTTDYSSLGQTDQFDTNETIEVWLSVGRDQANILRKLIDESFTPQTGIKVDLKLVNGAVLLPATLSKVGPDVAMGLSNSLPVNYAMRSAVYDLSNFDDFGDITTRFKSSAMVPFEYEGGYYALPEQQIFLIMFYRTDIFEELNLSVPNTWDDVIRLIPDLQKHNLEFYLPVPITQGAVMNLPPNPIFSTLFYQNDGQFYIDGNTKSGFNEGKGPEIFEQWTSFYTDYSFPVEANFVNRFRSGQMPIGITYYNIYNTLAVFAPEIRGKWDFVSVPGTVATDEFGNEYIRRETVSTGTSTMIMNNSLHKEASWEYLKWWTSTDVQVRFGRELEGILGAAARYPTANVDAMAQLPWTMEEYQKLNAQWDWVRGIPEVPGGYMTGRHLDNAFRLVYNESANPRETLYDYVQIINEEISKKRREFGLNN
jgi:ABC-type glycerol-3-phosphate transport system substrate-binding protein